MSTKKDPRALAERFRKRYRAQFEALDKSPLARVKRGGIDEWDTYALGKQLRAFELWRESKGWNPKYEDVGSMSDLGDIPKLGLDVIAANFGVSPLSVLASIQPIEDQHGIVWYKELLAVNSRGNVAAGDRLVTTLDPPDVYPIGYSEGTTRDFALVDSSNANQTYTNVQFGGTDDFIKPLNPLNTKLHGTATFNTGADVVDFGEMIPDPDTGEFGSAKKVNSTVYYVNGTVNFTNATVTFAFSADPTVTKFYISAEVLQEKQSDLQSIQMKWKSKDVYSKFYALKSTYGTFEEFLMRKRWGKSADDEVVRDLTTSMNNEIMNAVIAKLIANIPSSANVDWTRQPGSGVSYYEHLMTLPAALTDASAKIMKNAGRGGANVWMGGLNACAILETLPGFQKAFDDSTFGPHVFGTYRGQTIVRVPSSLQMDENTLVGIHKGPTPFEAPVVWCPLMPLMVTDEEINGVNPLDRQRAVAIAGATEVMLPNFTCKVTISQTAFDFGTNVL